MSGDKGMGAGFRETKVDYQLSHRRFKSNLRSQYLSFVQGRGSYMPQHCLLGTASLGNLFSMDKLHLWQVVG